MSCFDPEENNMPAISEIPTGVHQNTCVSQYSRVIYSREQSKQFDLAAVLIGNIQVCISYRKYIKLNIWIAFYPGAKMAKVRVFLPRGFFGIKLQFYYKNNTNWLHRIITQNKSLVAVEHIPNHIRLVIDQPEYVSECLAYQAKNHYHCKADQEEWV